MSNSNDDNITVDCADESFRMTLLCGVRKMQKYPAISLLVIAWHDRVEVSHRLAVGGIHQYMIVNLQALAAFEDAADIGVTAQHLGHHEEGHSLQMRFAKDVLSVISVLRPHSPHRKRCFNMYQVGYIWRQARQRHQDVPDASAWGWTQDVNTKLWVPFWTVLDDASKACALLHHCGCGKACRGNCKCARAGINQVHYSV